MIEEKIMETKERLRNLCKIYLLVALVMVGALSLISIISYAYDTSDDLSELTAEPIKLEAPALEEVENLESLMVGGVAIFLQPSYLHNEAYEEYKAQLQAAIEEKYCKVSEVQITAEAAPLYDSIPVTTRWVGNCRLNVRSSPEITDNIINVYAPAYPMEVIGEVEEDWLVINYPENNGIAYLLKEYTVDIEPGSNPAPAAAPAKQEVSYVYTGEWNGKPLTKSRGRINGPSGSETYYNLDMSGIVNRMHRLGYEGEYWEREDGCKMFGDYILIAADFSTRPIGTILETSLGLGIVADTGGFVEWNPTGIDIATTW